MLKKLLLAALISSAAHAQEPCKLRYSEVAPLAVRRNLDLQIQAQNVDMAKARIDEAEGQASPKFGLSSTYVLQDSNITHALFPNGGGQIMLNSLGVQIPVYSGGGLEAGIDKQKALHQASQQDQKRNQQLLEYQAKQQFLDTLLARENGEVAAQTLQEATDTLTHAQNRKTAGTGTRFDVLQAQVAVSSAQQQVTDSQTAWETRQANLAHLLHLSVDQRFEIPQSLLAPSFEGEQVASQDLKSLTLLALDQRPELASLRAQLQANEAATEVAASTMRPQFSLNINYAALGSPSDLHGGWQIIGQFSIPLFDGGVSDARQDELGHRKQQLQLQEQQQISQIALEVRTAHLELQNADAQYNTALAQVQQAREAVRLARIRFNCGAGTSLELVTAQANQAAAQYSEAAARRRQIGARAALNLALGI